MPAVVTKPAWLLRKESGGVTAPNGVTHGVTVLTPELRNPAQSARELPVGLQCDSAARSSGDAQGSDSRKGDRHKLGQAAYMREYRKRKKAG